MITISHRRRNALFCLALSLLASKAGDLAGQALADQEDELKAMRIKARDVDSDNHLSLQGAARLWFVLSILFWPASLILSTSRRPRMTAHCSVRRSDLYSNIATLD